MLWLYRLLFLPALLVLAPRYAWRMRRRGGYRRDFSQRFGIVPRLPPKHSHVRRIWLQAVSVGEMLAIAPLLEAWQRQGGIEVYLTTTTSTGHRLALDRYLGRVLAVGYFPLDWWLFSRRAWRQVRPDLVILTEGERWPEHLHQARVRGVPVVCLNARLSDRSFRRMRALRPAVQPLLAGITRLLPCSEPDAARFRELGFPADRITTTGNIKLDVTIPPLDAADRAQLRRELGLADGLVLLGSSTWRGEEDALLRALRQARGAGLRVSLLIVPRHAERRGEIEALLKTTEFTSHLRSRGAAPVPVDVCIADTTGELRRLTQLADLVFVGKSLAPHTEGQTPVEAAALEKPILLGPGMGNFRQIAAELTAAGAAQVVASPAALADAVASLLPDAARRTTMAAAARSWHRANQGAVQRSLMAVGEELGRTR
ncbi:MAG TPA: glycosyltransferase N-terminal domain-containing protein [Opitutaceae bacterium]|nr:glycosyltransferase N-terminal domain-containing protein [Opitutaceae bacterium]